MGVDVPLLNPMDEMREDPDIVRYSNPQFLPDNDTVKRRLDSVPFGELKSAQNIDEAFNLLKDWIEKAGLSSAVDVAHVARGIKVTALAGILFPSGSDRLLSGGNAILDGLSAIISKLPNYILIEGFTDDMPAMGSKFKDNTELSQARADYARLRLIEHGQLPSEKLISIGRGAMSPVAPNDVETNRAKNRRVEITLLRGEQDAKDGAKSEH